MKKGKTIYYKTTSNGLTFRQEPQPERWASKADGPIISVYDNINGSDYFVASYYLAQLADHQVDGICVTSGMYEKYRSISGKGLQRLVKEASIIQMIDGQEIWTNAFGKRFGDRVCVGVDYPYCWCDGKKFKPTTREIKALADDLIIQEFGSVQQMEDDFYKEFEKANPKK